MIALLHYIKRVFWLDYRALALLRIGTGILLLIDLIERVQWIEAFAGPYRTYPASLALSQRQTNLKRSIHGLVDGLRRQYLLFFIATACIIAVIIWYKTRIVTIISWLLLLSLHVHNPWILNGGDTVIRLVMFRCMFLPWGHVFSLDAWLQQKSGNFHLPTTSYFGPGSIALLLQLTRIYFFNFLFKSWPDWSINYMAIYFAFSVDATRTALWDRFRHQETRGKLLTKIWYLSEWMLVWLLLVTDKKALIRTFLCLFFIGIHLGLQFTMKLGLFPMVMVLLRVAILPRQFRNFLWPTYTAHVDKSETLFSLSPHWTTSFFVFFTLFYVLNRNIISLEKDGLDDIPKPIKRYAYSMRIDQARKMFSPKPTRNDGRHVIQGNFTDQDGQEISRDIWFNRGEPVDFTKPEHVRDIYPYRRWRKFLFTVTKKSSPNQRKAFIDYLCYTWTTWSERDHWRGELTSVDLFVMKERSKLYYEIPEPEQEIVIHRECRNQ